MEIRRAKRAELHDLFRIQLRALELDEMLAEIEAGETPALYRHAFLTGNTVVARNSDQLLGFAVGYERDGTWFLGEFFVLPDAQAAGAGKALLAAVMPERLPCATVSTSDYRAQALYARSGMTPLRPSFNLRVETSGLRLPEVDVRVVEAERDPAVQAWDTALSGRERPQDLRFLLDDWGGSLYWLERAGRPVGYAGVAWRGGGRVTLGPLGVRDTGEAADAVSAMATWLAGRPDVQSIIIDVPGPHPALPVLLAGGFRIADQNLFCSSAPARFGDPRLYLPLTPALY